MLHEGDQIGPYTIDSLHGAGGMATVYKAYHTRLDRHVAIKMMHQALLKDEGFRSRFEREARIIAQLEHPNIVPVYDFSDHEGKPFLVMKFVEGETLEEVLAERTLTLDEIVPLLTRVADALTYAHRQDVLHRDIKPSNIVIDQHGTPFLTDFGLARLARQGTSTLSQGAMIGTPHYISPEQALGIDDLTPRADVYSLGVVLYELVVGCVPFAGESAFAIVHDHIYTPVPDPCEVNPECPPEVKNVLLQALAKAPEERYTTPDALAAAFQQAVKDSGLKKLSANRSFVAARAIDDIHKKRSQVINPTPGEDPRPAYGPPSAARIPAPAPPLPPVPPSGGGDVRIKAGPVDINLTGLKDLEKLGEWGNKLGEFIQRKVEEEELKGHKDGDDDSWEHDPNLSLEERARRRVEKRHDERVGFISHLASYVLINGLFWLLASSISGLFGTICTIITLVITLGWGIGLFAHWADYNGKYGAGAARREQEIEREIAREAAHLRAREAGIVDAESVVLAKRKHEPQGESGLGSRRVRLTEDGELSDSFVIDQEEREEKPKRAR